MIKIENIKVFNFENAMKGMRNPLESWNNNDTNNNTIGSNDLKLAQKLIHTGTDHSKFMRQIFVSMDIEAPIFWWKEMDQYRIGCTTNSTSTMHKLATTPISRKCFSFEKLENLDFKFYIDELGKYIGFQDIVIYMCEILRKMYLETKDEQYWRALIELLPESWNQKRMWTANYQVLRSIYFARHNHKLKEWKEFCKKIEELPYGKELICYKGE